MEIIVGKNAGFCYGVKRVVEGTIKYSNEINELYYLGEIVHNKQVIEKLEKKGINFVDTLDETKNTTIIRAHGVPKSIYSEADNKKIDLIDFTCPNVLKIHKIAEKYSSENYYICLCGSGSHPENKGTISYCGEYYSLLENEDDVLKAIEEIKNLNMKKVLLISQTTFSLKKFDNINKLLKEKLPPEIDFITQNTICRATEIRQNETSEISKKVDCMIIIGGKNSSNTKKLYEIANENCANSICIEVAEEIKKEEFEDFEKIGIMAGASTPKESIEDVIKLLS